MTDLPTACRRRVERFVDPSLSTTDRATIVDHAKSCPACAERIAAFERIRGALGAHHADLEPDAAFRARVLARVAAEPPSALGWAARRLLPLAAALALVLSGWSLTLERPTGVAAVVFGSLDDDVLAALVVSPPGSEP